MPRCPNCYENIEYLCYSVNVIESGTVYDDGDGIYYDDEDHESQGDFIYSCPICGDSLNMDFDEAKAFIEGTPPDDNKERKNISL